MNKNYDILQMAKKIFEQESQALVNLIDIVGESFEQVVKLILGCNGHIIVIGVGKSGLIGKKMAATLSSLGTPSFFVHGTEAVHGDLGMIKPEDICLLISHSGETPEIINVFSHIERLGNKVIAITGNANSTIAKKANFHLDTGVKEEADSRGLAPTTSTLVTLALGDALALVLADLKEFSSDDFGRFHPGGSIGLSFDFERKTGKKGDRS